MGFPNDSSSKKLTCNAQDAGLIPGMGRCPGEGNGKARLYSCLENLMDGGAWWATYSPQVHKESDMTSHDPLYV